MSDAAFENPRVAHLYDVLEGDRGDLGAFLELAAEFGVLSVLDIGCGTGTLACLLAQRGVQVTALDPARASLEVARRKPCADRVRWLQGDAATLPPLQVDLVVMTGNVAQVFLDEDDWAGTLGAAHAALKPDGHLVFEVRNPDRQAWREWNREQSYRLLPHPGGGAVETWVELTDVSLPYVSFRWTFAFVHEGITLTSNSTLRFRSQAEIRASLQAAGCAAVRLRVVPDGPGQELVLIATPAQVHDADGRRCAT